MINVTIGVSDRLKSIDKISNSMIDTSPNTMAENPVKSLEHFIEKESRVEAEKQLNF
jgi:hypothetical protein